MLNELRQRRDELLFKLLQLDQSFSKREISKEGYQELRRELERELWEIEEEVFFSSIKTKKPPLEDERRIEYEKPHVRRFLTRLLDNSIEKLIPSCDPTSSVGYRYPEAEDAMQLSSTSTTDEIKKLADLGILVPHYYKKNYFCPNCDSSFIRIRLLCPSCNGDNISKAQAIEHYNCGYVGFQEEFKQEEKLVCPKCNKELKLIGSDYHRPGLVYKCFSCGNLFESPILKLFCQRCESMFGVDDVVGKDLYSYTLNQRLRNEIKKSMISLELIQDVLSDRGYRVLSPAMKAGKSGIKHNFDLLAVKDEAKGRYTLAVEILMSDNPVEAERILHIYTKILDTRIDKLMVLAMPGLSEEAKLTAETYGIGYVEAKSFSEAVQLFHENLTSIKDATLR